MTLHAVQQSGLQSLPAHTSFASAKSTGQVSVQLLQRVTGFVVNHTLLRRKVLACSGLQGVRQLSAAHFYTGNTCSDLATTLQQQSNTSWLEGLFSIGQQADQLVQQQLTGTHPDFTIITLQAATVVTVPQLHQGVRCTHACRCDIIHLCHSTDSWIAHKLVSMHSQCSAPYHWVHRRLLS